MLVTVLSAALSLASAINLFPAAMLAPQNVTRQAAESQDPPAPPTGPMRLELYRMIENRVWNPDSPVANEGSGLRFLLKLTGERLPHIVRAGDLIIEKMVDNTGVNMIKPDPDAELKREMTQRAGVNTRIMQQGFMPREQMMLSPTRTATSIAEVEGYVNLVYATENEAIYVRDPLQFEGRNIEHPRLAELGIVIRVLKAGEEVDEPGQGRGIALRTVEGEDHIQSVGFNDAWYRRMNVRPRGGNLTDSATRYTYHAIGGGRLDADCEMVIMVFPKIEREKVRFSAKDVPLP